MPNTVQSQASQFVTLTPNPALDRVLELTTPVRPHELQRVVRVHEQAGGKGVNVGRVLRALGADVTCAAVLGGFNGQKFAALLEAEGLNGLLEYVKSGETRECQILTAPQGHPTEVNEPGLRYDVAAMQKLLAQVKAQQPVAPRIVSGSLAPGCQQEEFAALLREWQPIAVDTSGAALETALEQRVPLVKPNQAELAAVAGASDLAAARRLYARSGTQLLVTQGAAGAWLVGTETWVATPPVLNVSNPVGAGDSTLAGFVWGQEQGFTLQETLRWAIAAGSASALLGGPQHLTRSAIESMLAQVEVKRLDD